MKKCGFFLNGKTNTKELEEKGIMFWNGNTNREFLDSNGLEYLDEGELGCAYSEQIRNFGGYDEIYAQDYGSPNPVKQGKDQLKELFDNLGKDKYSRRHVITLWNPQENEFGVLTPCWHTYQFVVIPENGIDTLHLKLINRSLDTLFGARFAIQQYRLLQMALCKAFDFELGYLSCDLTHIHLYENQIEYTKELLLREYAGGDNSIELTKEINSLDDLLSLQWTDFKVEYTYNNEKFTQPRPKNGCLMSMQSDLDSVQLILANSFNALAEVYDKTHNDNFIEVMDKIGNARFKVMLASKQLENEEIK